MRREGNRRKRVKKLKMLAFQPLKGQKDFVKHANVKHFKDVLIFIDSSFIVIKK